MTCFGRRREMFLKQITLQDFLPNALGSLKRETVKYALLQFNLLSGSGFNVYISRSVFLVYKKMIELYDNHNYFEFSDPLKGP